MGVHSGVWARVGDDPVAGDSAPVSFEAVVAAAEGLTDEARTDATLVAEAIAAEGLVGATSPPR